MLKDAVCCVQAGQQSHGEVNSSTDPVYNNGLVVQQPLEGCLHISWVEVYTHIVTQGKS